MLWTTSNVRVILETVRVMVGGGYTISVNRIFDACLGRQRLFRLMLYGM